VDNSCPGAGPAAQTPNSPYIYFPVFWAFGELVYAPGAPGVSFGSWRFFWEICWDTGLTTRASGSINADAARSCREEREIELEYLMLIIPLKIALIIFLVWMFMP